MKNNRSNRRDFIKKSTIAATGLSLGLSSLSLKGTHVRGANDRIRVGFIGVGNRGSQLLRLFMAQPDCEVAALCDVYEPYLLQLGFLERTPRGRLATERAYQHLNIPYKKQRQSQPTLWEKG